ncbi:MAG: sigma-70 family RNA polymerase sigma factor [Planctomycetota bacterium]
MSMATEETLAHDLCMEDVMRDYYSLIHWQVQRMRIPPGSYDDMVQEAVLAVTRKLPQFDPERGRIEAWICATVRHGVLDCMRSTGGGPIRVSRHLIRRYREQGKELGEVCASLDEHMETGEETTYRRVQSKDEMSHTELVEKRDMLEFARRMIPKRHREVLDLLYPLSGEMPMPMREAGAKLGISESRISQLRKEALLSMRSMLGVAGKPPRYARAG